MAGGFAVIKDVPKTLVYQLAEHANRRAGRALIPSTIFERPPSAELRPGQMDQDTLPPYPELDAILEAYVEGDQGLQDIVARGFDASASGNRVTIGGDPALVLASDFSIGSGEAAAGHLLDLPEPPTAIFAFNDNHAIGVLQAARTRGLVVPDDLSVVGFDDVEHATIVTPTLTTVRQPLAEMGRTAVSLLMRLVERQRFETLHVELATRLVVRESTAPPRSS